MNNDEDWQRMSSVGRWNQKDDEGVCETAGLELFGKAASNNFVAENVNYRNYMQYNYLLLP